MFQQLQRKEQTALTAHVKRNDQIEMEQTFKSSIQVWTVRNSVIFFRLSRKKQKQETFNSKNEKLQFRRNYEFAKTWNREENGSSKNTNFLYATMYGARLVPHIGSVSLTSHFL